MRRNSSVKRTASQRIGASQRDLVSRASASSSPTNEPVTAADRGQGHGRERRLRQEDDVVVAEELRQLGEESVEHQTNLIRARNAKRPISPSMTVATSVITT